MTEVISVRFRSGSKSYYFNPKGTQVTAGQAVLVETASGTEFATCTMGNHQVPDETVVEPFRSLIRIATDNDKRTNEQNRKREKNAFSVCKEKIAARGLEMKLIRVESNFEGSKIIFFFTADGRVDFRELVKDLAGVFRARIELRQVGVRDEAKMLGGIGICGQPLCCSRFLDDFMPVSIKMAKTQNLSLNPTKISGTCGRLMCCLKYEQNAYEDAVKRMPKNDSFVNTPDGIGNVTAVDLLKEEVKVKLDSGEPPKNYKNCEIQVLRNGKGSREGIEIPATRPQRYVSEEVSREERQADRFAHLLDSYTEESDQQRKARRAGNRPQKAARPCGKENRGNHPEKQANHQEKAAPRPEKGTHRSEKSRSEKPRSAERKSSQPKPEKIPVRVSGGSTAEKKAAADKRAAAGANPQPAKAAGEKKSTGRRRHFRRGGTKPNKPKE